MNPEDVTADMVRFLHGLGVNRASLGIQSMHDVGQKVLKRCAPEVNERAIDIVRGQWDNVSFDVLLGVPNTTIDDLRATIRFLTAKEPRHLSVYGLEPGGDLGEEVERFFRAVDPDRVADEYLETWFSRVTTTAFRLRAAFERSRQGILGGDFLAGRGLVDRGRSIHNARRDATSRAVMGHVEARIRDEGGRA
jgi:hypothetical protein